jgi:hypothetical protein
LDVHSSRPTFIESALIWIEQRAHILVYDIERVCEAGIRRCVWRRGRVVESCDVLAGAGAKVYDIAPVVCLLLHLLAQRAAAVASAFLSQVCGVAEGMVRVKERCSGTDRVRGVYAGAFGARVGVEGASQLQRAGALLVVE